MHQRQASTYGRKFFYGKNRTLPSTIALEQLKTEPGLGLVPPEFDDLDGGELDAVEDLRGERSPS